MDATYRVEHKSPWTEWFAYRTCEDLWPHYEDTNSAFYTMTSPSKRLEGGLVLSAKLESLSRNLYQATYLGVSDLNAIFILPWHRNVEGARSAVVDHESIWMDEFERDNGLWAKATSANDYDAWASSANEAFSNNDADLKIHTTFMAAENALHEAEPWLAGSDSQAKLQAIFAPNAWTCEDFQQLAWAN